MNGTLTQRSPSDVLAEVQRRQASGILRFQNGATTRQLFIDAGYMIRFAVSTLSNESITALFRDKGGVTEAQVKEATAAKEAAELLAPTLVRLGILSKDTLTQLTREHIHRVTLGALAAREGSFEFQAGALPFREQLDGGLSSAEILLEWARAFPEIDWIRRRFGSVDARIQMSGRPPEGYQKVPLNPAEGYIMSRVDGRASAGEICMVSPMGEETTLRALFGLALSGILEMPEGSVEIPPPAGPAAAAARTRPGGGGAHPDERRRDGITRAAVPSGAPRRETRSAPHGGPARRPTGGINAVDGPPPRDLDHGTRASLHDPRPRGRDAAAVRTAAGPGPVRGPGRRAGREREGNPARLLRPRQKVSSRQVHARGDEDQGGESVRPHHRGLLHADQRGRRRRYDEDQTIRQSARTQIGNRTAARWRA